MPDPVKRCGCSVGNLYLRVPNKETYFKALQAEVMSHADALVRARLLTKQLTAMDSCAAIDSLADLMAGISTRDGSVRQALNAMLRGYMPLPPIPGCHAT
jgi:AcrR family transcriptional regulator